MIEWFKNVLVFLFVAAFGYLSYVFVTLNWNILEWPSTGRAMFLLFVICFGAFVSSILEWD